MYTKPNSSVPFFPPQLPMGDIWFILPLTIVVMLHHVLPIFSAESPNITTDQMALLALKAHITHDPQNLLKTNWSTGTDVCSWIGVSCGSKHPRVTALSLRYMSLTGTIPPALGNLSFLTLLNIRNNSFHGSLPIELANLHRLKFLSVSINGFNGKIPSWFGSFTQLERLFLYNNNFSDIIPSSLGNLTKLEMLSLYDNTLQGQIPMAIGNLSNLQWLYLYDNILTGHLPSDIFNGLPMLQELDFSLNQFSGRIPVSLSNCKELQILSLSINSLDRSIPVEMGNLTKLNELYLVNNNLEGSIPSSILNISSLQLIHLGYNKLWGHLSSDMFHQLPDLQSIDLSENKFKGRIPTSLFKCKELQNLYLYFNQLEGTVPTDIKNLTWLYVLRLDYNHFQGEIPPIIGNMSFLNFLEFSSNNFTGRVPALPPLASYFSVSNNKLDGEIPSSICNQRSIQGLSFSNNNLVGNIPHCLGNLSSSLLFLELDMNNFHGPIPRNFAKGCSIRYFDLNKNQLEGPLPQSLVNCKDLEILNVAHNNLNDTFPYWLGDLGVKILVLRANRFYGAINDFDEVSSSFSQLRIIDLSSNDFNGYLPMKVFENLNAMRDVNEEKAEYMQLRDEKDRNGYYGFSILIATKGLEITFERILTTLVVINFSNNRFKGQIPKVLGELHALRVFNLSHNSLMGPVPSLLGNLSLLESLDLSSNNLEGRIPVELVNLIFLEVLNLSWNNLIGLIPQGKQFNTFTNDSYIGNLGLCGLPLSKRCSNDKSLETQERKSDESDDDTKEMNWKYSILMGYGCGLVFGLSVGYIVFTIGKPWWLVRIIERVQEKYVRQRIQ